MINCKINVAFVKFANVIQVPKAIFACYFELQPAFQGSFVAINSVK
jgi:hypothetical protein